MTTTKDTEVARATHARPRVVVERRVGQVDSRRASGGGGSGPTFDSVRPSGLDCNSHTPAPLGSPTNQPPHQHHLNSSSSSSMSSSALARAAFPKTLKELRLHLCQTGQGSAGAR